MLVPKSMDMRHKSNMFKLLTAMLKDPIIANSLYFKGGSYAAIMGLINRFSIDLDFDILTTDAILQSKIKDKLHLLFTKLKFRVSDESQHHLQFFLKYEATGSQRNTLKLEVSDRISPANEYETVTLKELGLVCRVQTISTMVANKFVAALNRYDEKGRAAGRDFFDLREFMVAGLPVNRAVVEERMGTSYEEHIRRLLDFVKNTLKASDLYVDLNPLLPPKNFKFEVDQIIPDLTMLLTDELARAKSK